MKLIIGCGYLGQRVAAAWLKDGHRVAALTRSAQNAERFRELGIEPVIGDVLDPASLTALPAAETVLYAVGYDRDAGRSQRDVYVDGLENVLKEIAGRTRRFLYISSTSVYGQSGGEWVDEWSECTPITPNGQVCLDAERVVWRYFAQNSPSPLPLSRRERGEELAARGAVVLRLAGIYGPGRLAARVDALKAGEPPGGNPDAWLNLIHVDDAVRAVLATEQLGQAGATFLVCDDQPITRREYYQALAARLGITLPETWNSVGGFLRNPRSGFGETGRPSLNKRVSNRRLREELGVQLAYPTIATGLPAVLEIGES
jgi:nucleoside-diphosphate-sugar epimerase